MKKLYERAYVFFQKYPLMISIGYMCIYFPIFSLLEQFCEPRYVIHCALDDMIPFNEWFVIPYVKINLSIYNLATLPAVNSLPCYLQQPAIRSHTKAPVIISILTVNVKLLVN